MSTHGAQSTFPSVTDLGRDVFWERTFASLPLPLVEALRSAGLDDPGTLVEHLRSTLEEAERAFCITLGGSIVLASSGAASSEKSTATYGHSLPLQVPEWSSLAGSVSMGGVPKTGHASFTSETGGDQNRPCILLGRRPNNRPRFLGARKGRRPEDRPCFLDDRHGRRPKDRPFSRFWWYFSPIGGAGNPNCHS